MIMKQDRAENSLEDWQTLLHLVANQLNNIEEQNYHYAVIGSGAYVLHGVNFIEPSDNPADLDITTTDMKSTCEALIALQEKGDIKLEEGGRSTGAVKHFVATLKNGHAIDIEITFAEDFGFKSSQLTKIDGVKTTSLIETLLSIYLRPEHRTKDINAFRDLVRDNIENLPQALQKSKINNKSFSAIMRGLCQLMASPEVTKQQGILEQAVLKILTRFKLPKISNNKSSMYASRRIDAEIIEDKKHRP